MGLRERTPRTKALKHLRCPKCGKLIHRRYTRCKTCHAKQPAR